MSFTIDKLKFIKVDKLESKPNQKVLNRGRFVIKLKTLIKVDTLKIINWTLKNKPQIKSLNMSG